MSEPRFSYQNRPVISAKGERSPGTEPDSWEITIRVRDLEALAIERGAHLYEDIGPRGSVSDRSTEPPRDGDSARPFEGSLQIRGDLVLFDGTHTIAIADLYVRDDGIEALQAADDEAGEVTARVTLADIRMYWPRRGELWGTYNRRLPNGEWDPASLTVERVPYSLIDLIGIVLQELPGRPRLVKYPEGLREIFPPDITWEGKRPKEELDRLLAAYRLTFNLTLEGEAELTDERERPPADARPGGAREVGGAGLPEGRWRRRRRISFIHRPEAVRIVGPRTIREITVDLEPVGYAFVPFIREIGVGSKIRDTRPEGADPAARGRVDTEHLVSWADAGASYGLSLAELSKFALLKAGAQGEMLKDRGAYIDEKAAEQINEWNFRLFRIPAVLTGLLPILEERAVRILPVAEGSDSSPQELVHPPPLVEAELVDEVRDPYVGEIEERTTTTPQPPTLPLGGFVPRGQRATLRGGLQRPPVISVSSFLILADERRRTRYINRPIGPAKAEVVFKTGLVKMDRPVGHLVDVSIDAMEKGQLIYPPRARITFAYRDSAAAREAVAALGELGTLLPAARGRAEVDYYYSYLAGRGRDGQVIHLNSGDATPVAPALSFPQLIRDDSFSLQVTINGDSNRAELDLRAKEIAGQLLLGPESKIGEDGEAFAFLDIHPSAVIQRVEWEAGPGVARTTWTIANAATTRKKAGLGAIGAVAAQIADRHGRFE